MLRHGRAFLFYLRHFLGNEEIPTEKFPKKVGVKYLTKVVCRMYNANTKRQKLGFVFAEKT